MSYQIGTATTPNATWGVYYQEGTGDNYFGLVQDESVGKTADLAPMPLYGSDSAATDVFDFGGTVRIITLMIEKTSTSAANMASFLTALLGLIQGDQSPDYSYPFTYTSTLLGAIKVKVASIDVSVTIPRDVAQLTCTYTIKFIESSSIG